MNFGKQKGNLLTCMFQGGMRLLSNFSQDQIIAQLKKDIPNMGLGFSAEKTDIEVISGSDEGFYLWLAINYEYGRFDTKSSIEAEWAEEGQVLLQYESNSKVPQPTNLEKDTYMCIGKMSDSKKQKCRLSTVGSLDMGGATMQIAFEFTSSSLVLISLLFLIENIIFHNILNLIYLLRSTFQL